MGHVFNVWRIWAVWYLFFGAVQGRAGGRGELSWRRGERHEQHVFNMFSGCIGLWLVRFFKKKKYSGCTLYAHPAPPSMFSCLPVCGLSAAMSCSWLGMVMVVKEMMEKELALLACDHVT